MELGLRDRVYVVTGGSRGLGFAGARALVDDGAKVVLCSRHEDSVTAAAEALGGREHALGITGDIGEPGTDSRLVATAVSRWGRLDGALLSVGGPPAGTATATTDDAWRHAFESVFLAPLRVARAVASTLPREGGAISFVLSSSVRQPIANLAVSNGLRPGLGMLAKTLADEWGPRRIRVTGLLPGRIDTDRVRELDAASGRPDAVRRALEETIPLGRYGRPDEFGAVAAFVLSPAASYLTGIAIPVDGGMIRSL